MTEWEWLDTADSEWTDTADSQFLDETTVSKLLSGTVAAETSVSGDNVKRAKDLTALFAAASVFSGAPSRHKPAVGSFAASSSVEAQISRLKELTGSFGSSTTLSIGIVLLSSGWEWLDTWGSEWLDTADAEWLDEFQTTKVLLGSLAATTSASAEALKRSRSFISYIDFESTFGATVSRTRPVQGQLDGQSSLIGAIKKVTALVLSGTIAASSAVSGAVIKRTRYVTATLSGQTNFAAGLIQRVRDFVGAIAASASLVSAINRSRIMQGSFAAASNVFGLIKQEFKKVLSGALAAASSVSATVQRSRIVQGSMASSSTISATISRLKTLVSYFSAKASFSSTVVRNRIVQGTVATTSYFASILSVGLQKFSGALNAASNLAGQISVNPRWVNATIEGIDRATGKLISIVGRYKITKEK